MDFGAEEAARQMYLSQKEGQDILEKYDSLSNDAFKVEGYDVSIAFATPQLGGATIHSYKNSFLRVESEWFTKVEDAVTMAKTFLEYFLSKIP